MKLFAALLLSTLVSSAMASEYERERQRPPQKKVEQTANQKMLAVQVAKASQLVKVDGASVELQEAPAAKIPDPAAIAPNPSAHAPSAQCRYGWSVTGAVTAFGAGISGSEWDEICGLWMAAQQTTGAARDEAAAAAFCLTMKRSGVHSPTCAEWLRGQGEAEVVMNSNDADIVFTGAGDR